MFDSRVGDGGLHLSLSVFQFSRFARLSEHLGEGNDGLLGETLESYRWF